VQITIDCNGKIIPYSMAKQLITMAIVDTEEDDDHDDEAPIYVKGSQKHE